MADATRNDRSLATLDSAQLLERARRGDSAALDALLQRHQAQVYRFGMRMCRDPEDAKDVLQDTLLALARGVRELRGDASVSTWLFTVARRFCIKKRSQRARLEKSALSEGAQRELEQLADTAHAADDALASKRVERALELAIRGLEPMYREVLLLRDVEGLSAQEAADVIGVSVQALKSRLHRARLAVRDAVAPLIGAPRSPAAAACPDVLTLFSRYLEDEISADLCTQMQTHVAGCEHCRASCDSLKQSLALCRASGSSVEVPHAVQEQVRSALRTALAR